MTTKIYLLFIIVLICVVSISCKSTGNHPLNDSTNKGAEEIKQELRRAGINSYYSNDSLIVVDKNMQVIQRLKIFASDTLYRIEQSQNDNFLFVGLASFGDCIFQFMGLIELKTKEWIVFEKLNTKSDDWDNCVLPNPAYKGTSMDKKYHLFEGGTGVIREFQVYNSSGKLIKKGSYMSDADNKQLNWDTNNKFYYYYHAESVPDSLPKPKDSHGYVQKRIWYNERDSVTNEFREVYFE